MQSTRSERIRRFSDLGKLQRPMTLRYGGEAKPEGFELCLCREQDGKLREERALLHGVGAQDGQRLLQFLYENAVPIENWMDVLQEARRRME